MGINKKLSNIVQALIPDARIECQSIPGTDIQLYLINPDYPQGDLPADVALQIMEQPLYWAFCWASGAVMARYLLKNPGLVKNKNVVDFGSGSGIVAIAAALAGAKEVTACDCDHQALLAINENAELNTVDLHTCLEINLTKEKYDLLLTADVLYDRDNLPLLDDFLRTAHSVIVADSRLKHFAHPRYDCITEYEACTLPDLDESREFRKVKLYQSQ